MVSGERKTILRQKTLKTSVTCQGVGLHSGAATTLRLRPGRPDSGICFVRTDVTDLPNRIPALYDRVTDTLLNTRIENEHGVFVSTIEHLMAALAGEEIDNAVIEVSGPEVPIMDGSSSEFLALIHEAGVVEQEALRRAIRILKPIETVEKDGFARLLPTEGNGFTVDFEIDFASPAIGRQIWTGKPVNGTFLAEISRARTFGFKHEVDHLRAMGLARGGSLENAVVVDGDQVLNPEGLRYEDEFVRHKVLDCVGDLYLAGRPIIGHFEGAKTGHAFHNRLLRALFADRSAWEVVHILPESAPAAMAV
ncbi:MAG: UDP-3-O-acyl-N-acetylglucosamine deacetylase [Alphaproteobacteria bacterium]|nr:UDP-3-O-acyl-N-acetylglucosamine deacetylase [Alphaproteobacteria bacterium]